MGKGVEGREQWKCSSMVDWDEDGTHVRPPHTMRLLEKTVALTCSSMHDTGIQIVCGIYVI